jgi:type II secretory pathway component PulC
LASCGIKNGDVLVAVNGENQPAQWRQILDSAEELGEATAEVRRGSLQVFLNYEIR